MSVINDGGTAFPIPAVPELGYEALPGMSLRDWFAGKALSGLISNDGIGDLDHINNMARCSYLLSDAMIAAREAKP